MKEATEIMMQAARIELKAFRGAAESRWAYDDYGRTLLLLLSQEPSKVALVALALLERVTELERSISFDTDG